MGAIMNADHVRLLVYDFDGVLTDNSVILREDGLESVVVNRSDGLAMRMLRREGFKQIIFTTEKKGAAITRARKLGIPIASGLADKKAALVSYCKKWRIPLECVMYVGNDVNDLEAMKIAGYTACPADAYKEIREIAKVVLRTKGGHGVARELLTKLQRRKRTT